MSRPTRTRTATLAACLVVALVPSVVRGAEPAPERVRAEQVNLASGQLRKVVARMSRGAAPPLGVRHLGSLIAVEILLEGPTAPVMSRVVAGGGAVQGRIGGTLIEALVPFQELERLEDYEGVRYLRPPLAANVLETDEPSAAQAALSSYAEVTKTNADAWHAAGWTGEGVKVGIIDYFWGKTWEGMQATGLVPDPSGTFCRKNGERCDVWTGGSHGNAVAQIVHRMAPDAEIYLATAGDATAPGTASDTQAAVRFFARNGVDIVTRSLTGEYDGPGDGQGPMGSVIDKAVSKGMVWFNSVGNTAGGIDTNPGSYWRGPWRDADGDGWLEWSEGDETLGFGCGLIHGLRWDDWGTGATDFDLYVADTKADADAGIWKVVGDDDQAAGADPLEHVWAGNACENGTRDFAGVKLVDPGDGPDGDVLEFMTTSWLEHWVNAHSATGPAADTGSAGGLAVGAIEPLMGDMVAPYSSRGPTNDGRNKPDLVAPSCLSTSPFSCFSGTSASTPVVAGAAALLIDAGVATTPEAIKAYLLSFAVVDRGVIGPDNRYGSGELLLPEPPAGV